MMRKLFLLSTLFLLFALSSILVSAHAERPDPQLHHEAGATSPALRQEYAPSRLLVKFRAGIGPLSQINGAWQTGQASLDRLLVTNEIQSARPLFAGVASEATLAAAGRCNNAARILAFLAGVYWEQGRQEDAQALLVEARTWAPELFEPTEGKCETKGSCAGRVFSPDSVLDR